MNEVLGARSGLEFLAGGGEMGMLIRAHNWSVSPLGSPERWSQSLRSVVGLLLTSKFPMFVAWGAELGFVYNDSYAEILGAKHPAALGSRFHDIWAEIWPDISPLIEAAIAGEASYREDLPLTMNRKGFNEQTWFTFSYSPVRNETGAIAGILCVVAETTDKVLAQRADREAARRLTEMAEAAGLSADFRALFEASPTPFLVVAPPDWTIVAANDARLRVTGTTRQEQIGRRLFDVFPDDPDDPNADGVRNLNASLDRVVAMRSADVMALQRYAVRGPDGRFVERWWAPVNSPVLDKTGEVALIIHQVEDVTEVVQLRGDAQMRDQLARGQQIVIDRLRTSEAALRESEARFRLTADAVPQIVWITDRHGVMEFLNRRFVEYTGAPLGNYKPAEMAANFIPAEDGAGVVAAFEAALESGNPFEIEHRIRSAGGEDRWFMARAEPYRDPETGEIIRWFGSSVDIHDRKLAEAALRQSEARLRDLNQTLETRVAERTAELEQAHEQLRQSQKLEAMGSLTGGIAHDFNNLLTPIIGSLDMLVRRGVGSERERRLIDGALQSADRAKTLVQRLLAFARRQPLQPSAVDLGALIESMAGLIGSTLGPTINVQIAISDDLPRAEADPNQVEMALLNLAVNARDAMPDGGRLTIEARRESVRGGHRTRLPTGNYVLLSVTDTGIGMDAATRLRAVEPFFSTKGIGKGTGLGLSMVHGLAAQLGGALIIHSAPGQGATIELWLPVSLAPVDVEDLAATPSPTRPRRGKALLVDDQELVRMSTADMLIDLGFQVIEAGSAEEALRLIEGGEMPDLLVTDHLMPGMSGADLARKLRVSAAGLPVLIVSGYAEVEGLAPDLPRLTKPFRNAELAERIATLDL